MAMVPTLAIKCQRKTTASLTLPISNYTVCCPHRGVLQGQIKIMADNDSPGNLPCGKLQIKERGSDSIEGLHNQKGKSPNVKGTNPHTKSHSRKLNAS